jgi:hypothetical protein
MGGQFMRYFFFLITILIATNCYATNKGWKFAVKKSTGEITKIAYGDSSFNTTDTVVSGVQINMPDDFEEDEYEWVDQNVDNNVQPSEIRRKSLADRQTALRNRRKVSLRNRIVDLSIRKDKASALGYTALANRLDNRITTLQAELQAIP